MSVVGFAMDYRRLSRTFGQAVALLILAALMMWSWLPSADAGHRAGRIVGEMVAALFIDD